MKYNYMVTHENQRHPPKKESPQEVQVYIARYEGTGRVCVEISYPGGWRATLLNIEKDGTINFHGGCRYAATGSTSLAELQKAGRISGPGGN